MKKNIYFIIKMLLAMTAFSIVFCQGCALIGIFGSETSSEKKIPAEIRLFPGKTVDKNKKLLVLIRQPSYLNAPPLLTQILTEQIQVRLVANAVLSPVNLVGSDAFAQFRKSTPSFYAMSPQELGKALNADWILVADLNVFQLANIEDTAYCSGELSGRVFLIEVAGDRQLWPANAAGRKIDVGFDIEKRGAKPAFERLASSFAHCATRYFYDCPRNRFKISDEKTVSELSQFGY